MFDPLCLRHEAGREKWRKALFRPQPPPFLGPLVSIKEAMHALDRSLSYVRARIEEGRLNIWKDPVSKRVWILKDDLDILIGDNNACQEQAEARRAARPARRTKPKHEPEESESEDLDAIGGWEAPKPPPVPSTGDLVDQWQQESEDRYQQKQRENDEWYAAELAKLEGRDPEEAVRQLQIERGWTMPAPQEPEPETESNSIASVFYAAKSLRAGAPVSPNKSGPVPVIRPISRSNPNYSPKGPVEPYIDPCLITISHHHPIIPPFPVGWITARAASNILDVSHSGICRLVGEGKLQRRKRPTGRAVWLYDSVEVEALAAARLSSSFGPTPGKILNYWGSRADPIALGEFDSWITLKDAARILGITPTSVGALCDRGLLPACQKEPGKRGSRVYVPHNYVIRLQSRPGYQKRREAKTTVRNPEALAEVDPWETGWPFEPAGKNYEIDHGEYYSQAQTARALKISVQAVHRLRVRGRLTGHKLNRPRKGRSGRGAWWFYRKEEVDTLRSDPVYNDHHMRWIKTRNRKAGWEETENLC